MQMESTIKNMSSPATIQFGVNLNCSHDNIQDGPLILSGEKKTILDEMDFFADKKDSESKIDAERKDLISERTELDFNVNTGLHLANTSSDQSIVDDGIYPHSEDKRAKNEVAVLQAELERMNTENGQLKELLNQVTNNYNNLQMHMMTVIQQQQDHHHSVENCGEEHGEKVDHQQHHQNSHGLMFARQFTDLGLAGGAIAAATTETDEASLSSSDDQNGHHVASTRSPTTNNVEASGGGGGYNTRGGDHDSSDKGSEGWGPNKITRLNPSAKNVDQATEATMRKARVSVRARSEAPMITDGCQWRKYGQKMAKGNPCPRAYYRCTMAVGCPVRKQVQRCAEDKTILITTYEGNHNHPLPPAAMAMASTTSSAARMLLSGSMPSADGTGLINSSNFLARTLLPCSSSNNNNIATISASAPFPTVTLDLTQNPNSHFQRSANNALNMNPVAALLPQIFGQALYNQSKFSGLQMSQDSVLPHFQQNINNNNNNNNSPLADTVNALTADPNFAAALAGAISSLMGSSHANNGASINGQNLPNNNGSGNNGVIDHPTCSTKRKS